MALKVRDSGGTLRTISRLRLMDGTSLRSIIRLKVMGTDGVTLRTVATFAPPISISTPSASYSGAALSSLVVIGPVTATVVGGLGPYTYAWSLVSGSCTFTAPTSATTSFRSPALSSGSYATARVRCTVTDSAGQTASCEADLLFEYPNPYS